MTKLLLVLLSAATVWLGSGSSSVDSAKAAPQQCPDCPEVFDGIGPGPRIETLTDPVSQCEVVFTTKATDGKCRPDGMLCDSTTPGCILSTSANCVPPAPGVSCCPIYGVKDSAGNWFWNNCNAAINIGQTPCGSPLYQFQHVMGQADCMNPNQVIFSANHTLACSVCP